VPSPCSVPACGSARIASGKCQRPLPSLLSQEISFALWYSTNLRFVISWLSSGPSEVMIHEILVPDCSDDGAAFLRAVLALLCPRNGVIVVLLPSCLMRRASEVKHQPAPSSGQCERCPHCNLMLPDEWINAAHSRVAGRTGGRPRVFRQCHFCKEKFGARELRAHMPICEKNPHPLKGN
jgi:hypothetical protein